MSLLDDVSVVVTPNGYKAGTLYGVLPTATLGSELVTGDNSTFESSTGDWQQFRGVLSWDSLIKAGKWTDNNTAGGPSGFTMSGGVIPTSANSFYIIEFKAKSDTSATTNFDYIGESDEFKTISNPNLTSSFQDYKFTFVTSTANQRLYVGFSSSTLANGESYYIDNVSVKEFTASDMDVTRATAATRVDENGLVNYAEVLGSEIADITSGTPVDASNWANVTSNSVDFTGLGASGVSYYNNVATGLVSGETYIISLTISNFSGSSDLGVSGQGGVPTSLRFSNDGTETKVFTSDGSNIRIFGRAGTNTATFSNFSIKKVHRNNVPRIDYTGGGCPHILAEPQRTNLVTYSEDFSQWSSFRSTLSPNQTTSPDGTINAYLVEQDYPNTSVHGGLNKSIAVTSGDEYTYSFFVKKKEYSFIELAEGATSSGNVSTWFDVENGVVGNVGAGSTAQIEDFGNGWYRCLISFTSAFTGGRNFVLYLTTANGSSVADIVGGAYIFGAQLEEGSYPTSYIPTSGSTVTRNVDLFTRDGISSLINSAEGVLFAEIASLASDVDSEARIVLAASGDTNNSLRLYYNTTQDTIEYKCRVGGGNVCDITHDLGDSTQFHKIACKWKVNDFALWVDGVEVGTDTSGSSFSSDTLNTLNFANAANTSDFFFGKVKQLQVYKTALTDMQLIQLTGTSGTDFYESYAEMASALTYTIQ